MFIVDLNANKRRGFTNLVAVDHKLRLEIGVGIYAWTVQIMTNRNLKDPNNSGHGIKNRIFHRKCR